MSVTPPSSSDSAKRSEELREMKKQISETIADYNEKKSKKPQNRIIPDSPEAKDREIRRLQLELETAQIGLTKARQAAQDTAQLEKKALYEQIEHQKQQIVELRIKTAHQEELIKKYQAQIEQLQAKLQQQTGTWEASQPDGWTQIVEEKPQPQQIEEEEPKLTQKGGWGAVSTQTISVPKQTQQQQQQQNKMGWKPEPEPEPVEIAVVDEEEPAPLPKPTASGWTNITPDLITATPMPKQKFIKPQQPQPQQKQPEPQPQQQQPQQQQEGAGKSRKDKKKEKQQQRKQQQQQREEEKPVYHPPQTTSIWGSITPESIESTPVPPQNKFIKQVEPVAVAPPPVVEQQKPKQQEKKDNNRRKSPKQQQKREEQQQQPSLIYHPKVTGWGNVSLQETGKPENVPLVIKPHHDQPQQQQQKPEEEKPQKAKSERKQRSPPQPVEEEEEKSQPTNFKKPIAAAWGAASAQLNSK